jgi:hypothetical protein
MHITPRASADLVAAPGNSGYLVRAYPGGHFLQNFFTCKRDAATYAHLVVSDGYIAAASTLDALRAPASADNRPAPLTEVSNAARFAYEPATETASAEDIIAAFGHLAYWRFRYRELAEREAALTADPNLNATKAHRRAYLLMQEAIQMIEIYNEGETN